MKGRRFVESGSYEREHYKNKTHRQDRRVQFIYLGPSRGNVISIRPDPFLD